MRANLIQLWLKLRASYYFIPSLMCVGAVALALLTTRLDLAYKSDIASFLGWFYAGTADGAKNILSVIAGSMISVAAVTFSLTMVAVTTAAGQYGPRLISNFMRDRANQFTLGIFLATFLYCLVVLRTVTSERTGANDQMLGLTPSLSVLIAIVLTVLSVGVLVFFVHHIPETLNVGKLTAKVGHSLDRQIQRGVFPFGEGLGTAELSGTAHPFNSPDTVQVRADMSGFIQAVSLPGLLRWSNSRAVRVHLRHVPGHFVVQGDVVAELLRDDTSQQAAADCTDEELSDQLLANIALGDERTAHQNILFLADELVEIAARALSPGVNDPFTAINCLHWFETASTSMMRRDTAPDALTDADGTPRLWADSVDLERLVGCFFGQSRQYIAGDTNASRVALTVLHALRDRAYDSQRPVFDAEIRLLKEAIREGGLGPAQVERLMGAPIYDY